MKKIFITGGSGFLGRQIVAECKNVGYEVYAPRSKEVNLETMEGAKEYFSKIGEIDCLINSSAYYGGLVICTQDPAGLILRNTRMIQSVFSLVKEFKVKKVVSIGSACAYPGHIYEDLEESMLFDGRCHPSVEAYGFTKRIQLVMQTAFNKQFGTECNHLILSNLYGEHDVFTEYRAHAISALIKKITDAKLNNSPAQAWGTGKPTREFVYVKDVARVVTKSIEFESDLEPINIGGHEISIRSLTEKICEHVGLEKNHVHWDRTKPDGIIRKSINQSKFNKLLPDFEFTTFDDGLRKTIDWYLANKKTADARV